MPRSDPRRPSRPLIDPAPQRLDFAPELLYGQEQQQVESSSRRRAAADEAAGPPMLEGDSDVTVLGKIKRRV
jgi:hypothetical protein